MEARPQGAGNRTYDEFVPSFEWARDDDHDTLLIFIPGFRREQLKVQVTPALNLRIHGERLIEGNRWSRFRAEYPIPGNCDTNGISAKFEGGILYVKHPKTITPVEPKEKVEPSKEAPKTSHMPSIEPAAAASVPPTDKQTNAKTNAISENKETLENKESTAVASGGKTNDISEHKETIENKESTAVASGGKTTDISEHKETIENKEPTAVAGGGDDEAKKESEVVNKESTDKLVAGGKAPGTKREPHVKTGHSTENGEKIGKGVIGYIKDRCKATLGNSNISGGGSMKELMKPKQIVNMVLLGMSVLVIMMYLTNAIRSIGKTKHEIQ